jgi:hypothetical protein
LQASLSWFAFLIVFYRVVYFAAKEEAPKLDAKPGGFKPLGRE